MVNVKSAVAMGLLASTAAASAAHGKHDKRHVHHRRGKACTTSAPYAVTNGTTTASAGTQPVITYTVVPVPVSHSSSAPAADTTAPAGVESTITVPIVITKTECASSVTNCPARTHTSYSTSVITTTPAVVTSSPAPKVQSSTPAGGSECGAATSYVTVQQTVTVTAGQAPPPSSAAPLVSSSAPAPAPVVSSSSSVPPPPPPPASTSTKAAIQASTQAPVVVAPSSAAPAPVSSTPASAPASGYSGSKLGAAWIPWAQDISSIAGSTGWCYDWQMKPSTTLGQGQIYVPTIHSGKDTSVLETLADTLASQPNVKWVKHLNEPDMPAQADMTPDAAATMHNTYVAPLMSKYDIALPAVSSDKTENGQAGFASGSIWLQQFIQSVGTCKGFAFADAHWYGWAASAEDQANAFIAYVEDFTNDIDNICPGQNLPIWFTEVGAIPLTDAGVNSAFWQLVSSKLDNNGRVARYAPFQQDNSGLTSIIDGVDSFLKSIGL